MSDKNLTVKQLAEYLNISLTKAYNLIRSKEFPSIKIGRTYLINSDLLKEWMKKQAEA